MSEELNVDIDQTVTSNDNVLPASKETEDGDEEFLDAKEDCSEANSQLTAAAQSGINNIQTAANDTTQPIYNESSDGQNLETNEDVGSCAEDTSMQPTEPESVETAGRETDTVQNIEPKINTFEEPTNRSEKIQSIDVDLEESSNAENQDSLSMNNKPDDSTGVSNDVPDNVNDTTILCDADQHSIPKVHMDDDNDKVNEEDHVSKNESSEISVDDADTNAVHETDETEEEEYMSDDEDIPLPGRRGKDEHSGDETYSESAENEEFEEEEIGEDDESDEGESEEDDESDGNYNENRQLDRHSEEVQETGDASEISENNQDKQEPSEIEADKDKENPMYVPRTGRYYMHDSRGNEEESPDKTVNEKETRRGINADRWQNDLYIESEQGPVTPKKMGQRGRQERGRYSSRPYGAVHNNDFRRQERPPIISNPFRRQNHPRSDNIHVHDNQRIEPNRRPPNITENININKPSSSRGGKSGLTPNKSESNISGGSSRIAKNNISEPRPPTRGRGRGKPRGYPEDNKPVGHSFEPHHPQDKREPYDRNSFREDNYRKPNRPNYSAYRSSENNVEQSYDNRSFPGQFGSRSGRGRGRGRNPRNPSPTGDPVKDMQAQRITEPGEQVPNRKSPLKSGRFKTDNALEENIRNELPKQNKPSYSLEFKNSKFRDQISNKFRNDRNYTRDRFHEETAPRFSQNRSQISVDEQPVGGKPVSDSNYNPPKRYSETRSEQAGLRPIRPQSYQKIDEQITTNVNSQSSVSAQPPVETKSPNNTSQENASLPAAATGVQQQQQMKPVNFIQNPNLPGQIHYDPLFLQQQFANFMQHIHQTQMIPPPAVPHPPQETANFASINPNPSGGTVYYTQSTPPIIPAQIQTQQFQKRQRMPLEVKNPDEP